MWAERGTQDTCLTSWEKTEGETRAKVRGVRRLFMGSSQGCWWFGPEGAVIERVKMIKDWIFFKSGDSSTSWWFL